MIIKPQQLVLPQIKSVIALDSNNHIQDVLDSIEALIKDYLNEA